MVNLQLCTNVASAYHAALMLASTHNFKPAHIWCWLETLSLNHRIKKNTAIATAAVYAATAVKDNTSSRVNKARGSTLCDWLHHRIQSERLISSKGAKQDTIPLVVCSNSTKSKCMGPVLLLCCCILFASAAVLATKRQQRLPVVERRGLGSTPCHDDCIAGLTGRKPRRG